MTLSASTIGEDRLTAPAEAPARPPSTASLPLSEFETLEALIHSWRRLEASASLPLQSHAFTSALSSTLLSEAQPHIFFVPDPTGAAALLPLFRRKGPLARWRMVGEAVFEPCDALLRSPDAARPLAREIVRTGRPLDLERIPEGSPLVSALTEAMRGRGLVSIRPFRPRPTIPLDPRWKDPVSCFNSGRRSDFRRAERRAREFGQVSFEVHSPTLAEFDALFDEAVAVEERSWKRDCGTAIASDRAKEEFFRRYFRAASEQGEFRLAFMRIDGRIVAMQMALESLGRYWLFKIGFDEEFGRCSPGTLLMLHTIGWAAQRELRSYELLGNVEPWIAQFWTREQHECVCLRAYPFNLAGAAAFLVDAFEWLRARVRRPRA